MLTDESMRTYLAAFLRPHGGTVGALAAEVTDAFGTPLMVVASGSVLQGFGNPASDVDLHVMVDDARVTDFPVSSHTLGVPVDINYIPAGGLRGSGTPAAPAAGRGPWRAARQRLTRLCRVALGLTLSAAPEWSAWQAELRAAFPGYAADWHRGEALRQYTAGRLLAERHPLRAAQRYCDAGLAAVDATAAEAGEAYVGGKWLGLKLERLGRYDLLDAYGFLLDVPVCAAEFAAYQRGFTERWASLTGGWALPAEPGIVLSPGDGYEVWTAQGRALVHRYALRGVELAQAPALPWHGPVDKLDADLTALIEADLLWLSVPAVAA